MNLIFDHVGIAVKTIEQGQGILKSLLQIKKWTEVFEDPIQRVNVQFGLDLSGICYELVAPTGPDSPIANAIAKKSNILNHLAYRTPDIVACGKELRTARYFPSSQPAPAVAYGGRLIQFFMSPLNMIVEIIEDQPSGFCHVFKNS